MHVAAGPGHTALSRGRGRIWPPRNSLNCGLRSTWSRCHTNRSTAPSRRSPTQGCATFATLTSLHPWAILGSPRCGCRGESQRAGDTNPGLSWGRLLRRLAAATGTGSARKARSASGTKKLPRGDHRPHVSASWGDHFLMLTTKNPIRCQIPPQQGAAVGVVLSFGADLIPILNLDARRRMGGH
jgi:hypothetical protein